MQTNILWTGREYYSLENCLLDEKTEGADISSCIIGKYDDDLYKADYRIITNIKWETLFLQVDSLINDHSWSVQLESDGQGNWSVNGEKDEQFDNCVDVDIPLTPFTNSLPICRLQLKPGMSQEISVVYCDILKREIRAVRQRYTCISPLRYHYENVPNDFEATIEVDEKGLVIDYPGLFVRTAIR